MDPPKSEIDKKSESEMDDYLCNNCTISPFVTQSLSMCTKCKCSILTGSCLCNKCAIEGNMCEICGIKLEKEK